MLRIAGPCGDVVRRYMRVSAKAVSATPHGANVRSNVRPALVQEKIAARKRSQPVGMSRILKSPVSVEIWTRDDVKTWSSAASISRDVDKERQKILLMRATKRALVGLACARQNAYSTRAAPAASDRSTSGIFPFGFEPPPSGCNNPKAIT
jgi:hypothetical protein